MLDRRITYRRRTSYKTRANHFKPVKTPGKYIFFNLNSLNLIFD